jgi:hypothetical protein
MRPLPPSSEYYSQDLSAPDPAPIRCNTITGLTCIVNFNTVCNKRGPQTIGNAPRLSMLQQLNMLNNCANNPPRRQSNNCLRVRWVQQPA